MTLTEAAACGTPAVASDIAGHRDAVVDGQSGLLAADVDALAAALRRVGGLWDIVYNDIDKVGYPDTVELAHKHLRPGGLFVTDNTLWSGRVLEEEDDGSDDTRGVTEFTRRLFAHEGFLTRIDPTRDGVAVALKI